MKIHDSLRVFLFMHNFLTFHSLDCFVHIWNPVIYMSEKYFDAWNDIKKKIDAYQKIPEPREGEVWFCSIGVNVGREQDGKHRNFERPVLVVRKWMRDCFLGVPLSSKPKSGDYFFTVMLLGRPSTAILIQMRFIDAKRLLRPIGSVSETDLQIIRTRLAALINKADPPSLAGPRRQSARGRIVQM
ncbi:MAG: mRNA interferase MazF [Patescibacteria group bacterium]|nr:mRNA interferase MazF [Patescibacteria group bacterium]